MSNSMIQMQELIAKSLRDFKEGSIVKGRILEVRPKLVVVDTNQRGAGQALKLEVELIDIQSPAAGPTSRS